jgi:integrase
MSTLYKRKRTPYWWWNTDYNGRRFAKSTKMTNKTLAKKVQQKWDLDIILGDLSFLGLSSNSNQNINSYVVEYLKFLSNRNENNKTISTTKGMLDRFSDYMENHKIKMLNQISVKNIDGYLDSLDVAPKTKKNNLQATSSMMKQAVKEDILKSNPCDLATLPKMVKDEKVHRPLQPIDLKIIFDGAGSWYMFYAFLYHTGLRAGDVASLRYGNIDFKKKSIVKYVRKSRRIHENPIADVLINMLDRNADKDAHLFPSLYTDKEQNDKIKKPRVYMQSLLKANGREKADLHSFRHTFNQSLLGLGMDIGDRQKLLAHASSDTTKIYTHPNFDLALQYVNRIAVYGKPNGN